MRFRQICLTAMLMLALPSIAQEFPRILLDTSGMGTSALAKMLEKKIPISTPAGDTQAVQNMLRPIQIENDLNISERLEELGFQCNRETADICKYVGSYFYVITLGNSESKRTNMRFEVLVAINKKPMEVKTSRTEIK